jgi:uncharacterized surface protein with fasciclin (FAS1) repeats
MLDLYTTICQLGMCKTFAAAVRAAGLTPVIRSVRSLTLLAPTDDAFSHLPPGYVDHLLRSSNDSRLRDLVTLHLLAGSSTARQLVQAGSLPSIQGQALHLHQLGQDLRVDGACLYKTNIRASNGMLHLLDRVLLPEWMHSDCGLSGICSETKTGQRKENRDESA